MPDPRSAFHSATLSTESNADLISIWATSSCLLKFRCNSANNLKAYRQADKYRQTDTQAGGQAYRQTDRQTHSASPEVCTTHVAEHTNTHRHRHTDRQTDRQTDKYRHMDRHKLFYQTYLHKYRWCVIPLPLIDNILINDNWLQDQIELFNRAESWSISTALCVLSGNDKIGSFSVIVWNRCCWAPGHGDCPIVSSRLSDQWQRSPDNRKCWAGKVVRSGDVEWLTVNDVGWQCLRLVYKSRPGTLSSIVYNYCTRRVDVQITVGLSSSSCTTTNTVCRSCLFCVFSPSVDYSCHQSIASKDSLPT